jgi:hypothetical protein
MSGSNLLLGAGAAGGRGGLLAPGALELSRFRDANRASPSDAVVHALQTCHNWCRCAKLWHLLGHYTLCEIQLSSRLLCQAAAWFRWCVQ